MTKRKIETKCNQSTSYKVLDNSMNTAIRILAYASTPFLLGLIVLFVYLNTIQWHYFIDEKFHIPQTVKYCNGKFFEWDPKITTLPGLYLFSALVLGPFNLCTVTYLRFINVICTYLNLLLIFKIVRVLSKRKKMTSESKSRSYSLYLMAWNITFFPPLFFWFFLYYTDIFSVTLILIMFLLHIHGRNEFAALAGALSVCVRQTNVIWVTFICIEKGLSTIDQITKKPEFTDTLNLIPCIKTLYKIFKAKTKQGIVPFLKFFMSTCKPIFPYLLVLLCFIIFVICNKGIVVGDRTAHVPTIHFTQFFYYSTFVLGFSWPYLLPYLREFINFLYNNLILSFCLICIITVIVHYNTLVHPYILADNRHYSFYIWKNFMNRYMFFKYLLVPLYAFAIYAILKSLSHLRLLSIVAYILCVCIVLAPQLLLEPRYFIIPYIFFRLNQKEPKNWQIVAETLTTSLINIAQFLIFINKSFQWADEKYPQRIAW